MHTPKHHLHLHHLPSTIELPRTRNGSCSLEFPTTRQIPLRSRPRALCSCIAETVTKGSGRYDNGEARHFGNTYNAEMMLDEQLDQEIHSTCLVCYALVLTGLHRYYEPSPRIGRRRVPWNLCKQGMIYKSELVVTNTQTLRQMSASSAAIDLAHLSQTSPRCICLCLTHTTQYPWGLAHPGHVQTPLLRRGSPSGAFNSLSVATCSVPATSLLLASMTQRPTSSRLEHLTLPIHRR